MRNLDRRTLNRTLLDRQLLARPSVLPLDAAVALTPDVESPTVSTLGEPDWVAVRVMIKREQTNHIMDALYELGARAILVTSIHAARI